MHTAEPLRSQRYNAILPSAVKDLAESSYAGSVVYLLTFITIIHVTQYQGNHPLLTPLCVAMMLVASSLRLAITIYVKHFKPANWISWFSYLTVSIAATWSVFWTYAIYVDGLNTATQLSIMASVGIGTAGVGTLAPLRRLANVVALTMICPSAIALSLQPEGIGGIYTVMMLIGAAYLTVLTGRLSRQYWSRHENALLLEERANQLAEATRMKSDFLARMSHEIRTPMNGILGMAQLLQATGLDAEQRKFTSTISQSGAALMSILNDILDLSRIEAGKLELQETGFKLVDVIAGTIDLLEQAAVDKGLTLKQDVDGSIPLWLSGDSGRFRQILINLTGNAIKFTEQGSITVRARAEHVSTRRAVLCIQVIDTGIGIPGPARASIFEAFQQADAGTTLRHGGSGLGLSIARQLTELMGGEIGLQDNPGGGVQFWLRIPFGALSETAAVTATSESGAAVQQTAYEGLANTAILVAEDNPVNQLFTREVLKSLGCRVTLANDGEEAVQAYRAGHFDAILMDMQMPTLDGFGATRAIRQAETGQSHTPIIALTANALKGEREHCLAAGLDDYLSKPFKSGELQDVLERWIIHAGKPARPAPA